MADIAQLHRRALEETRSIVAGIERAQWADATPCDDWDVEALLNHLVSGNFWAAELGAGGTIEDVGDRLDGDVLGDDASGAYHTSAKLAAAAFEAPGALEAPCAVSYGPVPGSVYAGHRFIDVLIHGWDLAVATGQAPRSNPDLWTPQTIYSGAKPTWFEAVGCSARTLSSPTMPVHRRHCWPSSVERAEGHRGRLRSLGADCGSSIRGGLSRTVPMVPHGGRALEALRHVALVYLGRRAPGTPRHTGCAPGTVPTTTPIHAAGS